MTDDTRYLIDRVRIEVAAGFSDRADVHEMIDDLLDGDADEAAVRATVEPAFARKAADEATWPDETDCDRLDRAFERLDAAGVVALHNAGYTMSDGHVEVTEWLAEAPGRTVHGFVFYHGQDVERAVEGHGLWLAYGSLDGDREADRAVGVQVQQALREAGLETRWSGEPTARIEVPALVWQRRSA